MEIKQAEIKNDAVLEYYIERRFVVNLTACNLLLDLSRKLEYNQ
jgi:hypothetical protein